jgi:hypothetical protein
MAKKLSDAASVILSTAAGRDSHRVLPLPKLKAPKFAVEKTIKSMIADQWVEEVPAGPDEEVWAHTETSGNTTLVIAAAGLAAIGIEDVSGDKPTPSRTRGKKARGAAKTIKKPARARVADSGGKPSKQDIVIALLRRGQGATIAEMMAATGWHAHSCRGFMSGALKRRLGLEVVSEKDKKTGERRYHIEAVRSGN